MEETIEMIGDDMTDDIPWERFKEMCKELTRRYEIIDEKKFEYRGRFGRASLVHDKDTGTLEWSGKQYPNWYRFYGRTLEEAEADFKSLVDGLIALEEDNA